MTYLTFLVTRASNGIRPALSGRLARAGHRVVGVGRGGEGSFPSELVSAGLSDRNAPARVLEESINRSPDVSFSEYSSCQLRIG